MIGTVFTIAVLRLWNNKQELLLAFVVPMLFFSIFALIFGRGLGETTSIRIAIIDDDRSATTKEIVRFLQEQSALRLDFAPLSTSPRWPLEELAKAVMRDTETDVVVHLPDGMEKGMRSQVTTPVQLLSEGSNPIGRQVVRAILTQAVASASVSQRHQRPIPFTPDARSNSLDSATTRLRPVEITGSSPPVVREHSPAELVTFSSIDVFSANKRSPKLAMYAAGIAVMFLLFSATGAGGSLLEENEAGTLDRLLSSRLGVTQLLAGKWLYIMCLGCVQLTAMFAWAQIAFGVDLLSHIPGFAVMTLATSAATASLALCLAAFCQTRAQLNGISIVLILTMSALGGSMVPRYIMSDELRRWGQLTFNAWALDGYKKVFWHDLPISALETEVQVLLAMAVTLAVLARFFSDRWAAH